MKVYHISRDNCKHDEYDEAVVVAHDRRGASLLHPDGLHIWNPYKEKWCHKRPQLSGDTHPESSWPTTPAKVKVSLVATMPLATHATVISASFNAGR